jgi:hypothetical protein
MHEILVIKNYAMWYFLHTKTNKKETYIELNGSYDKMTEYFFSTVENKKFISNVKFSGIAQKGFTHKLLSQTDYLENVRFGGIPVVSERFVEKMNQYLLDKVDFYPCQIFLDEIIYDYYLCRVKNITAIIDNENSGYRKLTDGSKILSFPIIIKQEIDENLFIVRDLEHTHIVAVSDSFKQIVEKQKLKIGFYI